MLNYTQKLLSWVGGWLRFLLRLRLYQPSLSCPHPHHKTFVSPPPWTHLCPPEFFFCMLRAYFPVICSIILQIGSELARLVNTILHFVVDQLKFYPCLSLLLPPPIQNLEWSALTDPTPSNSDPHKMHNEQSQKCVTVKY